MSDGAGWAIMMALFGITAQLILILFVLGRMADSLALIASAIEARRAADSEAGAVHESAVPKGDAHE